MKIKTQVYAEKLIAVEMHRDNRLFKIESSAQFVRRCLLVAGIGLLASLAFTLNGCGKENPQVSRESTESLSEAFDALVRMERPTLAKLDIARMNLLCAEGLPGAEQLDVNSAIAELDRMATRVGSETDRHLYRFRQNPVAFDNSEGFFRMTMLMVVLTEDFRVAYVPDKQVASSEARMGDGFFANSADVFLHGLTGDRRQGTCSSLPVLYVAVGRRLGYPLKLVTTKGHMFVRWEDTTERFNFEAAGNGANHFSDDYYRHWPMETSEQEIAAEGYLKSLSPPEELGVFLSIRAMCLRESGRYGEAAEVFELAARFAPRVKSYQVMAANSRPETEPS